MKKIKILQCGYGAIGKVLYPEFCELANPKNEVTIYDPPLQREMGLQEYFIESSLELHYDIAFICVPTPLNVENDKCDNSIVLKLLPRIKADVIVIKSTVSLEIVEDLKKYKNVIFSPEFTSTNVHKGIQNFIVLGGERGLCNKVAELYKRVKSADFEIIYTDIKTAIMAKYMMNTWLATKVTFCNEIAMACNYYGIEYDDVRNIFIKDSRINPSHTNVFKDQPYYNSHCLNKDVPAFVTMLNKVDGTGLINAVKNINEEQKHKTCIKGFNNRT